MMQPEWYTVFLKGRSVTLRSCGGPVGVYRGLTGDKKCEWAYVSDTETIVNGCLVLRLNINISAGW